MIALPLHGIGSAIARRRMKPSRLGGVSRMTGEKNLPQVGKTFGERRANLSRDEFRARIGAALRKRMFPNTGLRKTDVAAALGLSTATIDNWLSSYSQPDGYLLTQLIHFFDVGFANEVFGNDRIVVARLDDMRRFLAMREVNKSAPALAAIAELIQEVA
jgi:transcriptional regulator with XRE-family HTH domain